MKEQNDESSVQDSMFELAQDLSQSNFNVKQFKRMHAAKPIKISNQRAMSRIYTEHSETRFEGTNISLHSKTLGQGLNRTLRYVDTHIPPKRQATFFSKPMIKSADRLQEVRSKKKILPEKEGGSSNLEKYEKQWSKGKIKERCIEEWLNAILIQYCHDEYFDKNITNSALKKLGIDENSLVAKGLPPQNVSRLYRGLFVFGMGFNSLIGELTNGNMEVLKTIWRIYSIILEYCSKGGMVTVIGEIQRETSAKVAVLTNEIVRKQQIIQKNQELNEEKNAEIFREIKKLREDNANLNNQKTVLVQEYNSTEQAFSQEVNLRLKFQTKINQIYGLHRDLGIKHQRLFQNFSDKVEELRICADRYFESTIKSQEFKETQYRLREQLILLKLSSKKQQQYLDEIIKERIDLLNKISKLQYICLELQTELQEFKSKEKRWLNDKINMEATIQFREKSSKETHTQYQITLEQNNRLYILLSDQRKVMEQYQKEKRNFNSKVISIVSQNSYHKRKMQEIQRRYQSLQENYRQLTQKNQQLNLELQIKVRSQENYQNYFSSSQQNLVQMRKINIAHEEQLIFLRKFHSNMDKVLKDKNEAIETLTKKYEGSQEKLQNLTVQLEEMKSNYTLLSQQKRMGQESFTIKQAKLKVIEEELRIKEDQLQRIKINYTLEEQRLRGQLDRAVISYKNQKFQRTTLNSSYMQTLKIIEKKNAAERELNVKISLMEGEIEKQRTRFRVMEKSMMDNIKKLQNMQQNLEETLQQQREIIARRQEYQHPMMTEDLYARLHREVEKNTANTSTIKNLRIELQKVKKFSEQELQRVQQKHRWDTNVFTKQTEAKIEALTNQLSFQKQENSSLKQRIKDFEIVADSYKKKINQRQTSERQEVYRHIIEEKKKQIQKMFTQMEKLQDQLQETKRINAELTLKDENQSENGQKSEINKIESLRKQLQHEYNLKFRQLQRQMKQQLSRKEEEMKQAQEAIIKGMSIEQILKLKEIKAEKLIKELSVTAKTDKFRQFSAHNSVEISRQGFFQRQMTRNNEDMKNRKRINRLIKHAYQYYN